VWACVKNGMSDNDGRKTVKRLTRSEGGEICRDEGKGRKAGRADLKIHHIRIQVCTPNGVKRTARISVAFFVANFFKTRSTDCAVP
jgi:hypothetical protein